MNDNPDKEKNDETMRQFARLIDHHINGDVLPADKRYAFMLFVSEFGSSGKVSYIANAQRDDVVRLVEEWLSKQPNSKLFTGKVQ